MKNNLGLLGQVHHGLPAWRAPFTDCLNGGARESRNLHIPPSTLTHCLKRRATGQTIGAYFPGFIAAGTMYARL